MNALVAPFAPDSAFARPLVLAWRLPGAVALAATPAYLLARWRLLAPLAAFAYYFYRVAVVTFLPTPDDSLPVYLLGWPAFVAAALAVGGLEVPPATRRSISGTTAVGVTGGITVQECERLTNRTGVRNGFESS